jgi:hypothetical protein
MINEIVKIAITSGDKLTGQRVCDQIVMYLDDSDHCPHYLLTRDIENHQEYILSIEWDETRYRTLAWTHFNTILANANLTYTVQFLKTEEVREREVSLR